MHKLVVYSVIVASALAFNAPVFARTTKMHSARVLMRHVGDAKTGHYEVMMNGVSYSMIPKVDYDHLLQDCQAHQGC